MRRLLALLLLVAALVAPSSQAATAPAQLHPHGRWLVDAQGRVVLLHGVNAVWKRAPYVAPNTLAGFTAKDADWIAAQGFNTVRLGVLFAGVMPARGQVSQRYLAASAKVVKLLTDRKIWVLLDFHQDLYSEKFSGEGFPAWAVNDNGIPLPVDAGFPGNYFQPATSRAFDNFYANVGGLADYYAQAWKAVAQTFAATPYVLGFDLMNEPWPGTMVASCVNVIGCPVFDSQVLQPMYEKSLAAIRTVDRSHLVWLEPQVLFNDGAQTSLGSTRKIADPRIGFSWHHYCTTAGLTHSSGGKAGADCPTQGELVFDNADSVGTTRSWPTLLTEFGASDDLGDIARVVDQADAHLSGWQYWHYKEWSDPTTESQGSGGQGMFTNDRDLRTVKPAKADILIRPYARAVAGTPTAMSFTGGVFTLTYTADPRTGLTEVFLPARQYPRGAVVVATGASAVLKGQLLTLKASKAGTVTVRVTRR
jgi:endoglycosylceramidase